jgi:hypothetical protein
LRQGRQKWAPGSVCRWPAVFVLSVTLIFLSACSGSGSKLDERVFGSWHHVAVLGITIGCDIDFFSSGPTFQFRPNGEAVDAGGFVYKYSFPSPNTIRFSSSLGNQDFTYQFSKSLLRFTTPSSESCAYTKG